MEQRLNSTGLVDRRKGIAFTIVTIVFISLCSPGCLGTCFVDQAGLTLKRSACLCFPNAATENVRCLPGTAAQFHGGAVMHKLTGAMKVEVA